MIHATWVRWLRNVDTAMVYDRVFFSELAMMREQEKAEKKTKLMKLNTRYETRDYNGVF